MEKRISLRVWAIIQIIPALLLVAFYCMCTGAKHNSSVYSYLQYAILICLFVSLYIIKKKRDVIDECAKEIFSKADTICFKLTYVVFGILLLPCIMIKVDSIVIGYGIVGGLAILTILRSIIFCILDYRGM